MPINPSSLALASINGMNGFRLNGTGNYEQSGFAVASAGDVNGDGFDDVIVGAHRAHSAGGPGAGVSYVVFGGAAGRPESLNLANLDGTNGFRLDGIAPFDGCGFAVSSAGDVNGDGFDDVIIGARGVNIGGENNAGQSYVIFGKASGFVASLDLSSLDGNSGFHINGIAMYDMSGVSVSGAGDINGDGFADMIIGAVGARPNGVAACGAAYVVFGKSGGYATPLDLATLNGSNGFRLTGDSADDRSGNSVTSAGDINGDGFDDILIAGAAADPGENQDAGETYVIFGKASGFVSSLALASLDGTQGFRLFSSHALDQSGNSVATAGDINGDGFDDIVVGAMLADPVGQSAAGQSFVIFGKAGGFAASLDLSTLDGSNGFRLDGIDQADLSGVCVSSAGDVNGDGFSDIIIGANGADPAGKSEAGETYVIFGKATGFAAVFDLASLDGNNGFRIDGIDAYDYSGSSVAAAGDVNGDGFDDLIIGAYGADPGNTTMAGESYVIFGCATEDVSRTGTAAAERLFGGDYDDLLKGLGGNDALQGGQGIDRLYGGSGRDSLTGGKHRDSLNGGTNSDRFKFAFGDSGQGAGTMDRIIDFEMGAVNVGDRFDFAKVLKVGGSATAATTSQASINQTTGVASFFAGSADTMGDALHDITTRWTVAGDAAGEFALFQIGGNGSFHVLVSDGVAGVTAGDVLVRLTGITNIGSIDLTGGDLTILT